MSELLPPSPETAGRSAVDAVDDALRKVSRLLVSRAGADLGAVLELLGGALDADSVYFVAADAAPKSAPPPEAAAVPPVPTYLLGRVITWARGDGVSDEDAPRPADRSEFQDGRPRSMEGGQKGVLAVPLLAEDVKFVGYVGIGRSRHGDLSLPPCDRGLAVLGDVLGTHLSRLAHDEARAYTEERWRRLVDCHPDPTVVASAGVLTYANAAAARLLGVEDSAVVIGRRVDDFLSAEDVGRVGEAWEAQRLRPSPTPFEHDVIRVDGEVRRVESVSVSFPGADDAVQTVLRDLTERRQSEERYRTYVQTTSEGVWRLLLERPVSREAPLRVQADRVLSDGRFAELNPSMVRILSAQSRISIGAPVGRLVGSVGRRLVRALVGSNYDLRSHEVSVRTPEGGTRHFSVNAMGRFGSEGLTEVWGSCTDITERVAMERELVAVLEDQQERIARDLHDSVGQLLTGVRMLSDGLASRVEAPDEAETARKISEYSAEALDRVREICHGLVPPQLYSEGAAGALAELVEHVDALGEVRCVFRRDREADILDPESALQAYRIVQEALSNALRHAAPRVVWVTLNPDGDETVVEVEDDGVGFDLDGARSRSIGIYGMGRRAGSVGATLAIETAPGSGTTVRVTFPPQARDSQRGARGPGGPYERVDDLGGE